MGLAPRERDSKMRRIHTSTQDGYTISTWLDGAKWHGTATWDGRVIEHVELTDGDLPCGLTDVQRHRVTRRALMARLIGE